MLAEVEVVMNHDDLAALVDHVGRARRQSGVRRPGDIIGLLGRGRRRGDGECASAMLGGEFVQRRQVVRGHPNHLRSRFLEVVDRFAERVRLRGAAARESLGEEIKHHRPLLQLLGEVNLELLAANRAGGGEVRSLVADLEGGVRGQCDGKGSKSNEKLTHDCLLTAATPVARCLPCAAQ
jgi:hypothetical protein